MIPDRSEGAFQMTTTIRFVLAAIALSALAGCVPLALGAGGAVAADEVAEQEGGNLF